MGRKTAVWIKCASRQDMLLLQLKAVTGHLECHELPAEPSEAHEHSLDIEFTQFTDNTLDVLRKLPGVVDAGLIEPPREFTANPEETRRQLLYELPKHFGQSVEAF